MGTTKTDCMESANGVRSKRTGVSENMHEDNRLRSEKGGATKTKTHSNEDESTQSGIHTKCCV